MHEVLAALEAFHASSLQVFERVEAACAQVDDRLDKLEHSLSTASRRISAAHGSTLPLVVKSARKFASCSTEPVRCTGLIFKEHELASLGGASPLPSVEALSAPPTVTLAANNFSSVVRHLSRPGTSDEVSRAKQHDHASANLLAPLGRLSSVSELFLFNSREQPYRPGYRHVDNLAVVHEEVVAFPMWVPRLKVEQNTSALHLDEDEPDQLHEDIRFKPSLGKHMKVELPDVLPNLDGVIADLTWPQRDTNSTETDRPTWDAPPSALRRASVTSQSSRGIGQASRVIAQSSVASSQLPSVLSSATVPPPAKQKNRLQGPLQISSTETSSEGQAQAMQTSLSSIGEVPKRAQLESKPLPPPPPPPPPQTQSLAEGHSEGMTNSKAKGQGKGNGKGKGKGKGPPPPPKKPQGPPPPAAPKTAEPGSFKPKPMPGKADLMAQIRASGTRSLRKAPPPKASAGPALGRAM